jgi:hypothetical protein
VPVPIRLLRAAPSAKPEIDTKKRSVSSSPSKSPTSASYENPLPVVIKLELSVNVPEPLLSIK